MENKGDHMDLFRLASRRRYGTEWKQSTETPIKEPKPSHLNTLNSSGLFQVVSPDKMSVQYVGGRHHGRDVGAVQADAPAPTRTDVYYFEMTVKNAGEKGQIAIGFTSPDYNLRRQPGWDPNSCGYHGDDGLIYRGQGIGESFGPTYTKGDTVGAGISYASQEFFFTKNGKAVGSIVKNIKGPLYPTISVHGPHEEVTANFGEQPFLFDIKAFKSDERLKQQKAIQKLSLPPNVGHWIVRSYLLHYGYQDTLNSFDIESEHTSLPIPTAQENGINEQGDAYALTERKSLRQLIRTGDIGSALKHLREWYPQVFKDDQLLDAVNYARAELSRFLKVEPFEDMLEDAIALLAYDNPLKSSVGYLLEQSQREFVADAVNATILSTNPNISSTDSCTLSCLEKLLKQLTASYLERRALNEDQGEAFDLHCEQRRWGWRSPDD